MSMLELVLNILALAALGVGSITDLKKREVPDWVSYGLMFAALGTRLLYSIFTQEKSFFLTGLYGFIFFVIISHILYYLKQWGGGDAKILMAVGALIGFNLELAFFILLLILVGALYGLFFSAHLAIDNEQQFKSSFKSYLREFRLLANAAIVFLVVGILSFFVFEFQFSFLIFSIAVIACIGIYSFLFVKAVEDTCLIKKVKASELTEGDWVMETIRINNKILITENNLGITKEQMAKLKNYKKLITIRLGVPFIPAFFLSYVAFILLKTWFLSLL
jgi:Flp pilus assembly protein protease CpaA